MYLAWQVGRQHIESHIALCRALRVLGGFVRVITTGGVLGLCGQILAFGRDDLVQSLGDIAEHIAEVSLSQHLFSTFLKALEHVAKALHPLTVEVVAVLEKLAERRIRIAVVRQIVGHL